MKTIIAIACILFATAAHAETSTEFCDRSADIARMVIKARDGGAQASDVKIVMSAKGMDAYVWMVDGIYSADGLPDWMVVGETASYCREKIAAVVH